MLDRNGVIQLGVDIRNLKSFVAGEAYSGLTIAKKFPSHASPKKSEEWLTERRQYIC